MPDIATLRAAVATALSGVSGLRDIPADGVPPNLPTLPTCLIVMGDDGFAPDNGPLNLTMTVWKERIDVILVVSKRGGDARAERTLDALYPDVVEALRDGLAGTLLNIRRRGYGPIEVLGTEAIGAIISLEVIDQ